MKIAICFSGFLRTWQFNKDSFINVFCKGLNLQTDVDIFVHTYLQNIYEHSSNLPNCTFTEEEIKKMFEGLPVKQFIFEDRTPEFIKETLIESSAKYAHVDRYCVPKLEAGTYLPAGIQAYDQLRVIKLINDARIEYENKNNIKYNLVVRSRFDLYYHTSPDWNQKLMDGKMYTEQGATAGYPHDCVCICTPNVMNNCYAGRFELLDEICPEDCSDEMIFCVHQILTCAMQIKKIEIGYPFAC